MSVSDSGPAAGRQGAELSVTVLVGPRLVADRDLLTEVAGREFRALGVPGRLLAAPSAAAFAAALGASGGEPGTVIVALPGPDRELRGLMDHSRPYGGRLVWLDLAGDLPEPACDSPHLCGRGVWGLTWAIRHGVHHATRPSRRIAYGPGRHRYGDLYVPLGVERPPVAMLLHGGFYRPIWCADLMEALAGDLVDRGVAVWNVEYRSPIVGSWAATVTDVAAGHAALATLDAPLDLSRVAVIGHSAGGQLALRLAADVWSGQVPEGLEQVATTLPGGESGPAPALSLVVSLAGLVDLETCDRRDLSGGAIAQALGGHHDEVPEVYAASSPLARLPLGGRQLLVQGAGDDLDYVDCNRRYARAATTAGDDVTYLELPGDHFDVIDPASDIWTTTAAALAAHLGETR